MSSDQGLSRQQKGKAVAAASNPERNRDGDRVGDLELTHHAAMMDTTNLSRSQRLLVVDATRLAREGGENIIVRDARDCARDGQSGAMHIDTVTLRNRSAGAVLRETTFPKSSCSRLPFIPKESSRSFPNSIPTCCALLSWPVKIGRT